LLFCPFATLLLLGYLPCFGWFCSSCRRQSSPQGAGSNYIVRGLAKNSMFPAPAYILQTSYLYLTDTAGGQVFMTALAIGSYVALTLHLNRFDARMQ
jgi:hypothetical protein